MRKSLICGAFLVRSSFLKEMKKKSRGR